MKDLTKARRSAKKKRDTFDTSRSLKEALERIDELELEVTAIRKLKKSRRSVAIKAHALESSEAVAIAMATDWHVGSIVDPATVSNLNEFNVTIARQRIERFFQLIVQMTNKERQNVRIDELVLFLGGDLLDGALHLDTIMSSEVAEPMKQAVLCQSYIQSGLDFLQKEGNYKRITVVCCDGNHGRITHKMHHSSRQGNSLEYFMYYNLAARNPDMNWVIANGLHVYLPVYDYVLRFMHGDTISFGGINGPYTYLNRRIYQWDVSRKADFTFMGHLHWYCVGARRWLINGSLVGYNAYAVSLGGEFQRPIQSFMLYDKKRGPTVNIPLFV